MGDKNCPVVVLLGAGASIDAGLRSSISPTDALIHDVDQDNDPDLRRGLGLILGGIALQRGIDGALIDLSGRPDIETVLRVAQQLEIRSLHPLAGYVSGWIAALERLAPAGDGTVFRRLNQRARHIMKEALRTPEELTLVKYLAGLSRLGKPWSDGTSPGAYPQVFTLNYDRCLEAALQYDGIPYTTGFHEGLWTPSRFQQTDLVRIYKLKGSFGWVRDPHTSLLHDRDAALERTDVTFFSDDTPDELVFATETKLQALQPFLWLMHQFSEALAGAKYIVVVGYRFGDDHVNQILGQAMALDPAKRLLIVSPNFDPRTLEQARGMTYYQERVVVIQQTAKQALHDEDTVLKQLRRLESATRAEAPF